MAEVIKILSSEVSIVNTAASNVSSASLVRLVNLDGSNSCLIQLASNTGSVKATFTLGHHSTNFSQEYIVKLPTDTIQVSGAFVSAADTIRATSVAYV
jgi:hypothetical protein